ncbi:UBC-like protein [Mycena sanguinolenta]|uniref:UBC-like protein n=1 Tax=Mycena sanguinolenta TaxID=230812 RepID=A0A8H6Y6Q1_9AGAR|nr:UBC-like protein [Mycena sanguinolenta]
MLVNLVPSAMDFATRPKARAEPQKKSVPIVPDAIDPVTRTTISLEYASLQHRDHCPLGMYVVPSPESLLVWDAVFFVHQGYYADAILKFRLTFPSNYPDNPPTVQFVTDVFHPLISQSGMFQPGPAIPTMAEHRVFDVLHWIKAAFKKQALDGIRESECLNKEAYRLYHDTTSSFAGLASQSSLLSQSAPALFDRDHPTLRGKPRDALPFRELAPDQLQTMRTKIGLKEWQQGPEQR